MNDFNDDQSAAPAVGDQGNFADTQASIEPRVSSLSAGAPLGTEPVPSRIGDGLATNPMPAVARDVTPMPAIVETLDQVYDIDANAPTSWQPPEPASAPAPAPAPPGPWWSGGAQPGYGAAAPLSGSNPPAPIAPGPPAASLKTGRGVLVGAIVGALVGSLVTGGLFLAFRDDAPKSSTSTTSGSALVTNNGTTPVTPIPNTASGGINVKGVLGRVRPSVVKIDVQTSQGRGGGTGFLVTSDGTIVTNAHVVEGANDVQVTLANGDQKVAKVKGVDAAHDLAVIRIDGSGFSAIAFGDSDALAPGDPVVAVGNALGLGISVTSGVISALDRTVDEPNGATILGALQTDAAINPGNSGGPLVNSQGQVIGVNTAIASPSQSTNVGFAISISSARHIIEALIAGKAPRDAFFGVTSEDVTPTLVRKHDLKVDHGAYVVSTASGSAAQSSGIKAGDVVIEIDGTAINGRDELRRFIRRHSPGDRVPFTIVDAAGAQRVVAVRLGEAPAAG